MKELRLRKNNMKNVYNQDLEKRCEEMTESLVEFYMAEIKLNSADLDTKIRVY